MLTFLSCSSPQDYRWHWTSFLCGASVSLYVYLYALYYYFLKTKMSGTFQTAFYFGYMALFALALGVMCGTCQRGSVCFCPL